MKTGLPILVELIYLVNSVINLISNELTQMFNVPTQIPDCDSHSPALLDLYLSSDASIWLSLHWELLIMLLSQFPLTFH